MGRGVPRVVRSQASARPASTLYAQWPIRAGRFRAAMDTFDIEPLPTGHPYRSLPNVVLTPHRAGGTIESYRRIGRHLVEDLERVARGELPASNAVVTFEAARLQGRLADG